MEWINGEQTIYGSAHCGGVCNDPVGRLGHVGYLPVQDGPTDLGVWHTYSVEINRMPTGSDGWKTEVIRWTMDKLIRMKLNGTQVGDEATWAKLARSPMSIVFNVAVGGDW